MWNINLRSFTKCLFVEMANKIFNNSYSIGSTILILRVYTNNNMWFLEIFLLVCVSCSMVGHGERKV